MCVCGGELERSPVCQDSLLLGGDKHAEHMMICPLLDACQPDVGTICPTPLDSCGCMPHALLKEAIATFVFKPNLLPQALGCSQVALLLIYYHQLLLKNIGKPFL